MAFNEESYKDLTYEEALAVLEGEVSIIDPALIWVARNKAKEALRHMISMEEKEMKQTEGRYPLIDSKRAAGVLWGIWEMRDHIDFLKDFDAKTEISMTPPPFKLTHNQYQLMLGRACKTLYAVRFYGGTPEEVERAIKFAFVMIDAEKHLLDVDEAKEKYGFKELEDKYVRGIKED